MRKLILCCVLWVGCQPLPGPGPMPHDADAEPTPSPPDPVPAPVVVDAAAPVAIDAGDPCAQPGPQDPCRAAGENLCRLGCRAAGVPLWKTPKGTPYAEACRRAVIDGRDTTAKGGSRARCLAELAYCPGPETCR